MRITEATALIRTPLIEWAQPQSSCDLGSGTGTFTMALAQLLAPGSAICAVDFEQRALKQIPDQHDGVLICKIIGDLQSSSLRLPSVDGVFMANTLHFIQEQQMLLRRLLSVRDRFLIVEFESMGTVSGRLRKTLPTLRRGRSGASGMDASEALRPIQTKITT